MLTLLQINTVVNSGSTGRIAEEIGRTALVAGWRSVIAYGRNPRSSSSELIRIGTDWNVRLHGFRSRMLDDHGLGSRQATEIFIRKAEALSPDIVHLHNIHGYYLNIDVLFHWLVKNGTPVIWTLHDCWPFTGHCAYFDFVGCEKWKAGCFACPQTKSYPKSLFRDRSRKNWRQKRELFSSVKNLTLVPVSNWLEHIASQSFLGDKNILRIHNGVDTNIFSPRKTTTVIREKYRIGPRFLVLGCASVWDERKGLREFIALRKHFDEDVVAIVLIGLSEQEIAMLPAGIVGIRRTESIEQLVDWYSAADLFLNLTFEDNFPTVNLEALACGTPVCTYRTGGSPEAVSDDTGFVVERGDLSGVVEVINLVRRKGKDLYSGYCRARALSCYKKEERFKEYLALYEKLLYKG